ncbi:hypothetical protein D3C86_1658780 [compost metagenome]
MVASARTDTVMVCDPALPPIPATAGIRIARAIICWIVASNRLMTEADRKAVRRLTASQGTREREVLTMLSDSSSSPTPPRRNRSSSASS